MAGLEQAVLLARLGGPEVGVLMIDLDHFKQINDRHGHQAGDDVLRAAGAGIAAGFREGDVVMRYGGEEFAVAVTGMAADRLPVLAERVRERIAALRVPRAGGGTLPVTASVGVTAWRAGATAAELIARADQALYAAKAAGRDRVVLAPGA